MNEEIKNKLVALEANVDAVLFGKKHEFALGQSLYGLGLMGRALKNNIMGKLGSGVERMRRGAAAVGKSEVAQARLGYGIGRGIRVGGLAGAGVGAAGGAYNAATDDDPNTGIFGGALGGAVKGAAVGAVGGGAFGGGKALMRGSSLGRVGAGGSPLGNLVSEWKKYSRRSFSEIEGRLNRLIEMSK